MEAVPKISDFGLAKLLDTQGPTASNAIVGTASYMSPEQASGQGKRIGPAADVYGLGAILYELLTGRPPFRAATTMETVLQVLSDEPVAPRELQRSTPADLERICLKCLEKEPGKRYASAKALADDLGRYLRGEPVQARPLGAMRRAWRWCRRNRAVAALLATVFVTLTTGVIVSGLLAVKAYQAAGLANLKAHEAELAKARERNAASRLVALVKHKPDLLGLPPDKLLAALEVELPRLNREEVLAASSALAAAGERGSEALASGAPQMIGD
jgi:hypothetical protein